MLPENYSFTNNVYIYLALKPQWLICHKTTHQKWQNWKKLLHEKIDYYIERYRLHL